MQPDLAHVLHRNFFEIPTPITAYAATCVQLSFSKTLRPHNYRRVQCFSRLYRHEFHHPFCLRRHRSRVRCVWCRKTTNEIVWWKSSFESLGDSRTLCTNYLATTHYPGGAAVHRSIHESIQRPVHALVIVAMRARHLALVLSGFLGDHPDVLVGDLDLGLLAEFHLVAHAAVEVEELALAVEVDFDWTDAEIG